MLIARVIRCLALPLLGAPLLAQVLSIERHRLLPMQGVARMPGADLDGDGDQDLIGTSSSQLSLLRNLGGGRFVAAPLGAAFVAAIAAGDVDGDGDLDLLTGQPWFFAYAPGRLFRNNGAAGFSDASTQWPTTTEGTSDLELFDFDGDGDLDIVTANGPNGTPQTGGQWPFHHLYLNNGNGVFAEATAARMPNGSGNPGLGVVTGDIDGDGDQDIVFTGSNLRVFVQNAAGVAVETAGRVPVMFPPQTGVYADVQLLDIDGDNDLDLIAASSASLGVLVFANNGAGTFAAAGSFGPADIRRLRLADLDGDGRRDLLAERATVLWRTPLPMRIYRNTPGGFVDVTSTRLEDADLAPDAVTVIDCEGDGDLDLCATLSPQPMFWHNDGVGNLRQVTLYDLSNLALTVAAAADVEGDGDFDLAGINATSDGASVFVVDNPGHGLPPQRTELIPLSNPRPRCLAWIDADGDGDQDLFVGHEGQNRLFHRVAGSFVDVTASQLPVGYAVVALVGDVDGDGVADLVTADFQKGRLYRGNGVGGLVDVSGVLPSTPVPQALVFDTALLDYDLDGDLDVAQAMTPWGSPVPTFRLLRNDWPAPFVDVTSMLALPAMEVSALATIDIDRDGRRDLVLGSRGAGNAVRLLRAVGQGFVDETALRVPTVAPLGYQPPLAVVDFDGDGWSDVLINGSSPLLLRNTAGVLQATGFGTLPATQMPEEPARADFDGDGDQDVVTRSGIARNRERDLQIAAPPRLGQPGELVLHGHAGDGANAQFVWLFMATALGPPLPLPGVGTLALDLTSLQQVALRTLPASGGEASFPFAVPAQPSLLGAEIFAQALFAHRPALASWRLGNWVRLAVRV